MSSGAAGVQFPWDCGSVWVPTGSIIDIPAGGALETAIGPGNLTSLSANEQAVIACGLDPAAAAN